MNSKMSQIIAYGGGRKKNAIIVFLTKGIIFLCIMWLLRLTHAPSFFRHNSIINVHSNCNIACQIIIMYNKEKELCKIYWNSPDKRFLHKYEYLAFNNTKIREAMKGICYWSQIRTLASSKKWQQLTMDTMDVVWYNGYNQKNVWLSAWHLN